MNKSSKIIFWHFFINALIIGCVSFLEYAAYIFHTAPNTLSVYFRLFALALLPVWGVGLLLMIATDPTLWRVLRKLRHQEVAV